MSKNTQKPKPCIVCGTVMMVPAYKWNRKKYCSRKCLGIDNAKRMNEIRRPPKEYAKPPVRYGEANNKFVKPTEFTCERCGNGFTLKPYQIRNRKFWGNCDPRFCSNDCRNKYRAEHESGKDSPHWVGGVTTYRGRGWRQVRQVVVDRQGGDCARCGKHVGQSLPVHHVKPFREFSTPAEANSEDNLIGLCQSCHMKMEPRETKGYPGKSDSLRE